MSGRIASVLLGLALGLSFAPMEELVADLGRTPTPTGRPLDDPRIRDAVDAYFRAYADAVAACDVDRLWSRYPALSTGEDLERGINIEDVRIRGCGARSIRFELEHYEPMRVHEHTGGRDVRVHGLEWWDYRDGSTGGGEFIVRLRFQESGGEITLIQTDEVTIVEYHEGAH